MRAALVSIFVIVSCTLLFPASSKLHADETADQALAAAQVALERELSRYEENVRAAALLDRQLEDLMHRKAMAQAQPKSVVQANGAP